MANESLLPLADVKRHLRVLGERFIGMRKILAARRRPLPTQRS